MEAPQLLVVDLFSLIPKVHGINLRGRAAEILPNDWNHLASFHLSPGSWSVSRTVSWSVAEMLEIPSMVPYGADRTLYLVLEISGPRGSELQTAVERTDLEVIITDLLGGRFSNPVGVVAFNTLEHWSGDMSKDVAREIQCRCDIEGDQVPEYLKGFFESVRLTGG